jgi:hypothetical protein
VSRPAVKLVAMETMHAAGRRSLPPVPRPSTERAGSTEHTAPTATATVREQRPEPAPPEDLDADLIETGRLDAVIDDAETGPFDAVVDEPASDEAVSDGAVPVADRGNAAGADPPSEPAHGTSGTPGVPVGAVAGEDITVALVPLLVAEGDPAQQFVSRLRAAAVDFAAAAGAESAVVREAVPPARHRRSRCRVVLRYADESEVDVTFLGPAGRPGQASRHGFDRQIRRWLTAGQLREDAWLVADPDAPDGLAVDLSAWVAA